MDKQAEEIRPSLPGLLRAARTIYAVAIHASLTQIGCDDMPRNGIYVIGALARGVAPLAGIIRQLGESKQATGQLIDMLVLRGYLDRAVDPDDRRRMRLSLTERGLAAAANTRATIDRINEALTRRVGPEHVAHTFVTLSALIELDPAAFS